MICLFQTSEFSVEGDCGDGFVVGGVPRKRSDSVRYEVKGKKTLTFKTRRKDPLVLTKMMEGDGPVQWKLR